MSDLSDILAAQSVKIIGSDSSGIETNPVNSDTNGNLQVTDYSNGINGGALPAVTGLVAGSDGSNIRTVLTDNTGRQKVDISTFTATNYPHVNRTDVPSAARTTSGNIGTLDSNGFGSISLNLNISAVSGTNPTLQLSLDVSEDATNWVEIIKTVQFTTATNYRFQRISLSAKYYRYRWTIGGTSPSFTFSVNSTLKPYNAKRNVTVSNYADINLTAKDNVSSTFLAADANNISIMTIRAADGGNNSAFAVQASNDGVNWASISGNISQGANTTILTTFSNQSFRFYRLTVTTNTNVGTRVLDIHWGAS